MLLDELRGDAGVDGPEEGAGDDVDGWGVIHRVENKEGGCH